MIKTLLTAALAGSITLASAQTVRPLLRVQDIQTVSADRLANCDDAPAHVNDTVRVKGYLITSGGMAVSSSGRNCWLQDSTGGGAFSSINIFPSSQPTSPNDIANAQVGDLVEIVAQVLEYNGTNGTNGDGETELVPIEGGVTIIGPGAAPMPTVLSDVGVLNNSQRVNNLPTGEQWEGAYVTVQNVNVVAVNQFTSGGVQRVSFTVADASGNRVEVSDRFLAARIANGFAAPSVGDIFTSISGIIIHSKNGCPNTGTNNRGYTLNPTRSSDYVRGASAPAIGAITRTPVTPCVSGTTSICAMITDDQSVASATLYYAIGENNTGYTGVPMTATGNMYCASIPGQSDGSFIKYYISATDNSGNVSKLPNVPVNNPNFVISRCSGITIYDVQYTPFADGNSGYLGQTVNGLQGTVVSTVNDLGQVYIVQPGQNEWGGVWLTGGTQLSTLNLGDRVSVNGAVQEASGFTRIGGALEVTLLSTGDVPAPVVVAPELFSTYDVAVNEKYEGMFLRVQSSGNLFVVDTNVHPITSPNANFGEWRLGATASDPITGVIVQTGYQNNTNYSSLNVGYVNRLNRPSTWGVLRVPASLIALGDQYFYAQGIMTYSFGNMMLLPRVTSDLASITDDEDNFDNTDPIIVYPSPSNDLITIDIPVDVTDNSGTQGAQYIGGNNANGCGCIWKGIGGYQIYDQSGRLTPISGTIRNPKTVVEVGSLQPGLYNVKLTAPDKSIYTYKVSIVQ